MQFSHINNKNKKTAKTFKKTVFLNNLFLIPLLIMVLLISGCARWPEDGDGGDGEKQKLLLIRVDINENGKINTDLGKYYIVLDTRENAAQPPSQDIEEWEKGYYYIRLDNYGFCIGEWDKTCKYTSIGNKYEKYFQINLDLASIGNPKKIYMNVIITDNNDKTYDSIGNPSDLTIDTGVSGSGYSKTVQDFAGDSTGGPDFDLIRVTGTVLLTTF